MRTTAKLDQMIKIHISDNLDDYIQFGEFDPKLSAIETTLQFIQTYGDQSYLYEAIDGDEELAKDFFFVAMMKSSRNGVDTYHETMLSTISSKLYKMLIAKAVDVIFQYDDVAWTIWEERNAGNEVIESPIESRNINVASPFNEILKSIYPS